MCQWNSGGKRHSQKAGILPTPYHGNRYSIPEPCAKCKDIFCILPLFFYVLVPVQLYLRQLLFAQQNCGGDQIQQHRKQHGCIVAATASATVVVPYSPPMSMDEISMAPCRNTVTHKLPVRK